MDHGYLPPSYWSVERYEVARAYPGKKWMDKVARMPKEQVHEIYMSLRKRKEKERSKKNEYDEKNSAGDCEEQAG